MNIGLMLGIAVALAFTSYRNEKMIKEAKEKQKLEALKKSVEVKLQVQKKKY